MKISSRVADIEISTCVINNHTNKPTGVLIKHIKCSLIGIFTTHGWMARDMSKYAVLKPRDQSSPTLADYLHYGGWHQCHWLVRTTVPHEC